MRNFRPIGSTLALQSDGGAISHTQAKELLSFWLISNNLQPLSLRKKRGREREKITICTRLSFSSKNTHGLQVFGYQVLWLGGRPKCTEKECSARRQYRKTHSAPKHTRPEHSEVCMGGGEHHQPLHLLTKEEGEVSRA